ncbi:MAG: NAD(P)-dependent oxidoreductase [Betaproteobacteria bacterium]|nr:NAD(P)-dependent oxidoreductase [Betaproteobacteria bacterium]
MNVGFIGLGAMGRPMALHLLKGGHPLGVYARRPESARPLEEAGAKAYGSPAELAAACDAVFTIVTTTRDVEQVVLGERGIAEGARPGTVVVVMSTIDPAASRRIAEELERRGVEMLDAPVSGGEIGAMAGTLSIMVGGKPEVFERIRPLLECMGKTIVRIGESGAGQVAKMCTQLAIVATLQGIAEAVTLANAAGVDASKVLDALEKGAAASHLLELMGRRMVNRDFAPGVEARLHHKDAQLVLECARDAGLALPLAALATQTFNALMARGGGKLDSSAIVTVVEAAAGRR